MIFVFVCCSEGGAKSGPKKGLPFPIPGICLNSPLIGPKTRIFCENHRFHLFFPFQANPISINPSNPKMDRLAACHAMYGFLHLPSSGRGRHPSAPNCQNVKRSLSLTDRRGLISPGRGSARGLISPHPIGHKAKGAANEWEGGMGREWHGPHSHLRMHDFGLLMHAFGSGQMFLPNSSPFGRGRVHNRSFTFGRREAEFWSGGGDQLGQLFLSLRYSPADNQLWVGVLRASGVRVAAPYIVVWLIREGQKPEKRSTPKPSIDSRRFSIAPVFDEAFAFDVVSPEIQGSSVVISLMNRGSGGDSDAEIGYCVLGELGADEASKGHWREALGCPGKIITQWHALMADR